MPWIVWSGAIVLVIVGAILMAVTGGSDPGAQPRTAAQGWADLAGAIAYATVGASILSRQPRHVIGWLLLLFGFFAPTQQIAIGYAAICSESGTCNVPFLIGIDMLFFPFLAMGVGGIFLAFPHGTIEGRRRRVHFWLIAAVAIANTVAQLGVEEVYHLDGAANPLAPSGPASNVLEAGAEILGAVFLLLASAAVVDFVLRARRASGLERTQFRWLMWAGVLMLIGGAASIVGNALGVDVGWLFALGSLTIPVAIGLAMSRNRLYDVDRVIARTVSYSLVVGLMTLVFAAGVVLIPNTVGFDDSPLLVAASTLAVAASFNPVRKQVQARVDRRFNRSRYDAERVMDEFAGSLRDRVDPDGVVDGWLGVVSETMQPVSAGVWVRPAG